MRVLLPCFLALGCASAPAWEPVGGFELVESTPEGAPAAAWQELARKEFERALAGARAALGPVADYSATLETRERIEDELYPHRVMLVKLRREPFSVAVETRAPENEKGQRVWYDASWNDGEMMAETPGFLGAIVGRLSLDPEGDLALENRRHPITDIGLARLLEQIEESFTPELARTRSPRIRRAETVIGERPAYLVEALIPGEPPEPARIYRFGFDAERGLLVYYGEAELFPEGPALLEEYLYRDLRTNLGLTEADFRPGE